MTVERFSVLKWNRAVIEELVAQRPGNHSSVSALLPILIKHSQRDGTNCYPSQDTMSREAGLHHSTVKAALEWLIDRGLLEHVRNRARGLKEYRLQIADTSQSDQIAVSSQSEPDRGSDRGSVRGSKPTIGANGVTPLEDFIEEKGRDVCSNCGREDGHDLDCAHRPFVTDPGTAAAASPPESIDVVREAASR